MAGAEGFEPPLTVLETAVLPLKLRPCLAHERCAETATFQLINSGEGKLLGFAVRLMLAAAGAELLEFQPLRRCLLVLCVRIVPFLALGALERDDFSGHGFTPDFLN